MEVEHVLTLEKAWTSIQKNILLISQVLDGASLKASEMGCNRSISVGSPDFCLGRNTFRSMKLRK